MVTKGEPLVIMELMANGDLRSYLRSCRQEEPPRPGEDPDDERKRQSLEEVRKGPTRDPPTLRVRTRGFSLGIIFYLAKETIS